MWFELKGDSRLGRCASAACGGQPTWRLEAEGMGSNYCSGCKAKIEKHMSNHEPWQEAPCYYTGGGICIANCSPACKCQNGDLAMEMRMRSLQEHLDQPPSRS